MNYQVPCTCGKLLTVTTGDAGSTVTCACGKPVEIPGLRQLEELGPKQVVRGKSTESDETAGLRGIVGLVLVAAAVLAGCFTSGIQAQHWNLNQARDEFVAVRLFAIALSMVGTGLFASARGRPFFMGLLFGGLCGPFGLLIVLLVRARRR